jgi:hypothetical protein
MRTFRVDDVVVPVCLQQSPVGGVVSLVGGYPVGALQDCEEIGQQVDEHVPGAAWRAEGGPAISDVPRQRSLMGANSSGDPGVRTRARESSRTRSMVIVTSGTILPFALVATAHGK